MTLERRREETIFPLVCNKMPTPQKENCTISGENFDPATQLGDAAPQPQTIKATQNIVKNGPKSSIHVICPNNPSSPLFMLSLRPSKLHKMMSESGQRFTMTKKARKAFNKVSAAMRAEKSAETDTKMVQNELTSAEHDIG